MSVDNVNGEYRDIILMRTVLVESSMTFVIIRSSVRTMSVDSIGTLEMVFINEDSVDK